MSSAKAVAYTSSGIVLGVLACIFGVLAEVKKAPMGTPNVELGQVVCEYQSDVTVVFGILSIIALLLGVATCHVVVFLPYKGYPAKASLLFKCTKVKVFFAIAEAVSVAASVLTLWPTLSQHNILKHNIHQNLDAQCATAKTGLIGGGGLMSVVAVLMWFVVSMVSNNRKEDLVHESYKNHYDASLTALDFPYHLNR